MSDSEGQTPYVRKLSKGNLHCIVHAPNPRIIEALEILLEKAKSGELRGLVSLMNCGDTVDNASVGECTFTDILAAFEDWKFQQLADRNLKKL